MELLWKILFFVRFKKNIYDINIGPNKQSWKAFHKNAIASFNNINKNKNKLKKHTFHSHWLSTGDFLLFDELLLSSYIATLSTIFVGIWSEFEFYWKDKCFFFLNFYQNIFN